jgi:hypothetical protein
MPEIDVPIFNSEYSVCVIWDTPPEEVEKRIKKFYPETRFDNVKFDLVSHRGYCFFDELILPTIWVCTKSDESTFYATLAHESIHAVDWIFKMIKEHSGTEEIYAHCVAAIVREVEKLIKTCNSVE